MLTCRAWCTLRARLYDPETAASPAYLRKRRELREEYEAEIDALQFLDAAQREAFDQWVATNENAMTSARLRSHQVPPPRRGPVASCDDAGDVSARSQRLVGFMIILRIHYTGRVWAEQAQLLQDAPLGQDATSQSFTRIPSILRTSSTQ